MTAELVVMRLADMRRMHPRQDSSKVCSECSKPVGIYPSGQKALHANPGMRIVCAPCAMAKYDPRAVNLPAAPLAEIIQESRDSEDVGQA